MDDTAPVCLISTWDVEEGQMIALTIRDTRINTDFISELFLRWSWPCFCRSFFRATGIEGSLNFFERRLAFGH